eukprot:CAMPEP_0204277724 /NCGR_PEP_ID=MMETSP0468-20130131/29470_1 /ASSEMBLY_ACC=CAM_ASM_000383 /TAXON_ID=2969 /ORGANISM="Oxyrrhis marina" /LENGTH=71 /DNA_ID=CAMNT_0051254549 /DNA_START=59 /DNA_END=274 /DNA_ORIENTATION=+
MWLAHLASGLLVVSGRDVGGGDVMPPLSPEFTVEATFMADNQHNWRLSDTVDQVHESQSPQPAVEIEQDST